MRDKVVEDKPKTLEFVPDHFKTRKICEIVVKDGPCTPEFVHDHFKHKK